MMAHTFSTAEISLVALRDLLPPSPSLAGKHAARSPPKMISSFPSLSPRLLHHPPPHLFSLSGRKRSENTATNAAQRPK
jgi:hypothetical protein